MIQLEEVVASENENVNIAQQKSGDEIDIAGEIFYKISNVDRMRPFFMSLVSSSNHWLFISSNGGITAGRKESGNALFPYYTDDKIIESAEYTGSKSIFFVSKGGSNYLWEPFSIRQQGRYTITRNLYKNTLGNKIIFEEINHDLDVSFTYSWKTSDQFGFVRQATIFNQSGSSKKINMVDGIQNILPWGVAEVLQSQSSNLVDAYKKNELDPNSGLGIFSLAALIVDRAEPSEALKANTVWSHGLDNPSYLLSSVQLDQFRTEKPLKNEVDIRAERGAYFVHTQFTLEAKSSNNWTLVAEVNQDIGQVIHLKEKLFNKEYLKEALHKDLQKGSDELIGLVAAADGLQHTADGFNNARHFSNTLFNIMRGGIFDQNYLIEKSDFLHYLSKANRAVFEAKSSQLSEWEDRFDLSTLNKRLHQETDPDFIRLCKEYLPLKFSRRHGDPSRPWNKFSINTKSEIDGSKILDYQGNWRDIFQNWEALAHAYPAFVEGMIFKFLNASTIEGYNPYRLTKDGFDWETIEHDNPWSYIGYWGDHQIIYLLKFLEFAEDYYPKQLNALLEKDWFVFANVPYKIKPISVLLKDSKNTIDFDRDEHLKIQDRKNKWGADGALVLDAQNNIYHVGFIEKILISLLGKISNFIPEAGIWMNTQRPEWNDANNALVGNGASMVTLYYLRRFFSFFQDFVGRASSTQFSLSSELHEFFARVVQTLEGHQKLLAGPIDGHGRMKIFEGLGRAASDYREGLYQMGFSAKKVTINLEDLEHFCSLSIAYLDHSIEANKRKDQLYHAYNLVEIQEDSFVISHLSEMLEGQVAVLSSGFLETEESVNLLDNLRNSRLFRADQNSYLLYPDKELPKFLEKNMISKDKIEQSKLLKKLLENNNTQIIAKDVLGQFHFNASFQNVNALKSALEDLSDEYQNLVSVERQSILSLYESVFNHKHFTGRSGTFFGYEGLGSIYWHMVSKLHLAVYETISKAVEASSENKWIDALIQHFYHINDGIGVKKSPELYGAFPTDPYSHTPKGKGAQQPGMTGQVKEDLLTRSGELGVKVSSGRIGFHPFLLKDSAFLKTTQRFSYLDVFQKKREIILPEQSLAFTLCQIPIVYQISDENVVEVYQKSGSVLQFKGKNLDIKSSRSVFSRSGDIEKITVFMNHDPS
jgi:hypothetical protein